MQGRKDFTPQLFYELSLDALVPADNFYRGINQELDLHFLYKSTRKYYGTYSKPTFFKVKTAVLGHPDFTNQESFQIINLLKIALKEVGF